MGTNKERIEQLKTGLGEVQEGLHRMELGMADRLHHLEETLYRFSDVLLPNQESSSHGNHYREGNNEGWQVVSSKTTKLEFPRFLRDDSMKWFNRVNQFFEFQARPLTNLLKKGQFGWHDETEAAFLALTQAMTTTPTLAMPNFNDFFTIKTNAFDEGIGAALSQQGKPMAFMSWALRVTKKSWSIYAKKMLAIVEAIRLWRPYLLGQKFYI
ncbi:hypothetical protein F0562_007387 [Nyssa sinensis]|uniref:Reverse transcriptase/retrotransposon-derived protein RNase H-like domain-containing protein n=1 Tax=Nyssa sinensis TaxID=561372 RepID=A0A5J5A6Q2_9ASTE|nr:hypothetical protein F0562_007387 [Nyssa sinensis]